MPEVECSGEFTRALAFLASSVQMSWMPMPLIHGALSDMLSRSARQPQYHLSSVFCMQIPLVCPCSVMVVLIFGSKTMTFQFPLCRDPCGEHLRQDVVKTYRLVSRSGHDQFVKSFSSLHHGRFASN